MCLKSFQTLPPGLRRHKILRAMCSASGPVQRLGVNRHIDAFIDIRDGFARLIAVVGEFERGCF